MMKKRNGFTVIEVLLVLSIAGLIFLMMFLALPALQRSQRNTQRKEGVALIIDALKKFQTNNRGALPSEDKRVKSSEVEEYRNSGVGDLKDASATSWNGFYRDYVKESLMDPSGAYYDLLICDSISNCKLDDIKKLNDDGANATAEDEYLMIIVTGAVCDGNKVKQSTNPRKVAISYKLEGGDTYCSNT